MPTPLPPLEKSDFIAIVSAAPFPGGPIEADRLASVLTNYEDVMTAICRQLPLFASNNTYLTKAIAVFDDTALQNVGIYNAKVIVVPLADPVLVINSTVDEIVISTGAPYVATTILGISEIEKITISTNTVVEEIYIGPGTEVKWIDGSASGAIVNTIWLPFIRSTQSRLLGASNGSQINQIVVEKGSYFGGYAKEDPAANCASPVTGLATGTITHNTVPLTWTVPVSGYLFINIYFRRNGMNDWLDANESMGYFNGDSGYTFTKLDSDTLYEFRVIVVCINGGWSAPADITGKTICC